MSMHPYFTEQLVTDHRLELIEQADAHRLSKRHTAPPDRRRQHRLGAVLARAGQWLTPVSAGRRRREEFGPVRT